ncbi:MAG: hypothetical protein ACR5KW_02625 [Wolbachia sp.]
MLIPPICSTLGSDIEYMQHHPQTLTVLRPTIVTTMNAINNIDTNSIATSPIAKSVTSAEVSNTSTNAAQQTKTPF